MLSNDPLESIFLFLNGITGNENSDFEGRKTAKPKSDSFDDFNFIIDSPNGSILPCFRVSWKRIKSF